MSTPKVKAVLRWTHMFENGNFMAASVNPTLGDAPYYVLPADAESYDAMVEQMARAEWKTFGCGGEPPVNYLVSAQIALAAIGIRRRAARSKGRD